MKRGYLKRGTSQLKRSYMKRGTSQLARSNMNRVGSRGRANMKANKILKDVLLGINSCEIQLNEDCLGSFTLQNVHRHKRDWYKGNVELLSDKKQVAKGCTNCHEAIEHDADLTEEIFMQLRGVENPVDNVLIDSEYIVEYV